MNMPNQSEPQNDLNAVFEKIQEIAAKSDDGDYIYRGEPKRYQKVSSSLWRECSKTLGTEQFDIQAIQDQMLKVVKSYTRYTPETEDFEILTELQHYEGQTNLIDFTTDVLIALFFACDGPHKTRGRVILFQKTEEKTTKYGVKEPRNPQTRVMAQKSIFIQPPKGFIEQEQYKTITITKSLRQPMLDYLRKHHGISTRTIYNDLHGFIRNQSTHQETYMAFYRGATQPREDDLGFDQMGSH